MAAAKRRSVDLIVIHCSATREDREYTAGQLERDHRARGFDGMGYHFYVRRNGDICAGRPLQYPGAHAKGYNTRSVGVCYEGGLDAQGKPKDTRTPEQRDALRTLVQALLKENPGSRVCGHRDLSPDTNQNGTVEEQEWIKSCPCFHVESEL